MGPARRASDAPDHAPAATPRYADPEDSPMRHWRDEARPAGSSGEEWLDGPHPSQAGGHVPRSVEGRPTSFAASLGWTALSAALPGLGLLPTRRRRLGLATLSLTLLALLGVALLAVLRPARLAALAVSPRALFVLGASALLVAAALASLVALTHLLTRPSPPTTAQRALGGIAVALLSFLVGAPLVVGASYTRSQASLVNGVFRSDSRSQTRPQWPGNDRWGGNDAWAGRDRLTVLLLGADSTAARTEHGDGIRTDTIMVASIDTATGDTTIFQIPRNMARMPFPEGSALARAYPQGFYGGNADDPEHFANAVYRNVPEQHPELFTGTDFAGADALKLGVGASLGLDVDYFVMVNIDGLTKLIDAMGGVRLNVNNRIPVAGDSEGRPATGWIEPGPDKLLNGYYAMWYARSRKDSTDYNRMGRQTCVVKAVIDQADPGTMLTRYEGIARASKDMVVTDIPQDVLSPLVDLALRIKDGHVRRVLFVHGKDGFDTTDPDFAAMHARVRKALEETAQQPAATTTPAAPSSPTATATAAGPGDTPEPSQPAPGTQSAGSPSATPTVQSENVADACAYQPS